MMVKTFRLPVFCFILLFLFVSCDQVAPITNSSEKQNAEEIVKTDIAFSDMSRQVGMKKAFMQYMAKDGGLLRPEHPPIIGADAIDYLSQLNDTSFTITWKPSHSDISRSGDLGYTFGIYELKVADTIMKGTYVSIWKKQADGTWKFVLDSGNPGITSPQP